MIFRQFCASDVQTKSTYNTFVIDFEAIILNELISHGFFVVHEISLLMSFVSLVSVV